MRKICLFFSMMIFLAMPVLSSATKLSLTERVKGMSAYPGFFSFYFEKETGKIWLEINKWETEFLYINFQRAGSGTANISFDRNQLGQTRIVKFRRLGPKVFLVQPNYTFRAISGSAEEKRVVRESFSESIISGFLVEASEGERVLVDATDFFLRGSSNIVSSLARRQQGKYIRDLSCSALIPSMCKNFPLNTEVEAIITYTSLQPPQAFSFKVHHSFVRLPEPGYKPRPFDPRSGYSSIRFVDYSVPLKEPLVRRYIIRHRLKKKDPTAKVSEAVKPIVYYVDRGIPEPIRSAVMEGVSWWKEAFEALGYRDAFQVKLLPEGADPLDLRYNVVNWVPRPRRGWSYGGSIVDPRTGEILKGSVALGGLRIRQDYLIAQSLVGNFEQDKNNGQMLEEMALARICQLACHEVGHTLGLVHNYAASINSRASVMDYPHPLIKIRPDGHLDLSQAYAREIGEWDKVSIAYGYQDFPEGVDEKKELASILNHAFSRGLLFLGDWDATAPGAANPLANQWDNGQNPVKELERVIKVRKIALKTFSEKRIPLGLPLAKLGDVLVPAYFFHRYQVEATAKFLAGLDYAQKLRGDNQKYPKILSPTQQRQALGSLLKTIRPDFLVVPDQIWEIIPPWPNGYRRSADSFSGYTGPSFDSLGAAESAANLTLSSIFDPRRAARLVEYHSRYPESPGLAEVVDRVLEATWKTRQREGKLAEVGRVVDNVVLYHLLRLALYDEILPQVRALVSLKLEELSRWLNRKLPELQNEAEKAHFLYALQQIEQFKKDPSKLRLRLPLSPPPGPPI